MLSACEKTDDKVSLYQNADDCSKANPSNSAQCSKAFTEAKAEAAKPRLNTPIAPSAWPSSVRISVLRPLLRRE